jgi:lipopolysaccharide transport system permease protein
MSAELQMADELTIAAATRESAAHAPAAAPPRPEDGAGGQPPLAVTRIRPVRGWQAINVRELWQYRELLYFLTWRDVKVRYKQTALGAAWAVLQPAMMMVVFTIFFARMAGIATKLPYPVFVFLGLVPWSFFSTAISNGGNSVVGNERLITKIYFPRLAVPFAAVGAAVVDFLIAMLLMAALMVWYRVMPGANILVLPLVFFVIALLAIGVGTLLAALNVAYRDFRYVIPFLVQLWLFATPSIYMPVERAVAARTGPILSVNPMTWLIATFRAACVGETIPWGHFAVASAVSVVVFFAGCFQFRRTEQNFADII